MRGGGRHCERGATAAEVEVEVEVEREVVVELSIYVAKWELGWGGVERLYTSKKQRESVDV